MKAICRQDCHDIGCDPGSAAQFDGFDRKPFAFCGTMGMMNSASKEVGSNCPPAFARRREEPGT
jgi:hypothetical protein